MDCFLESRVGMAENANHARLTGPLFKLASTACTQGRLVHAHSAPSAKLRSAEETARLEGGRKMVRPVNGDRSPAPSASKESAVEGESRAEKKSEKR